MGKEGCDYVYPRWRWDLPFKTKIPKSKRSKRLRSVTLLMFRWPVKDDYTWGRVSFKITQRYEGFWRQGIERELSIEGEWFPPQHLFHTSPSFWGTTGWGIVFVCSLLGVIYDGWSLTKSPFPESPFVLYQRQNHNYTIVPSVVPVENVSLFLPFPDYLSDDTHPLLCLPFSVTLPVSPTPI